MALAYTSMGQGSSLPGTWQSAEYSAGPRVAVGVQLARPPVETVHSAWQSCVVEKVVTQGVWLALQEQTEVSQRVSRNSSLGRDQG